jgi:hypothetical protein
MKPNLEKALIDAVNLISKQSGRPNVIILPGNIKKSLKMYKLLVKLSETKTPTSSK